jgi:thiamine-phosphate pyrophosphorylase
MARAQHIPLARRATMLSGIYAIVNRTHSDPVALTSSILAGGVRIVQYRAKGGIIPEHARAIRALTHAAKALFIVNDDCGAAHVYDADGVHIGPDDADFHNLRTLRKTLAGRLLGVSCGTEEEAHLAREGGADYIGAGSVYATPSKHDAGPPIGIEGLRRIATATPLPVAAIGGITLESIPEIRSAGVAMAAVISAIASAPDARAASAALVRAWNQ